MEVDRMSVQFFIVENSILPLIINICIEWTSPWKFWIRLQSSPDFMNIFCFVSVSLVYWKCCHSFFYLYCSFRFKINCFWIEITKSFLSSCKPLSFNSQRIAEFYKHRIANDCLSAAFIFFNILTFSFLLANRFRLSKYFFTLNIMYWNCFIH